MSNKHREFWSQLRADIPTEGILFMMAVLLIVLLLAFLKDALVMINA